MHKNRSFKARRPEGAVRLEDIPNVGRSLGGNLMSIGIMKPDDFKG
jgi:hypothetical protein